MLLSDWTIAELATTEDLIVPFHSEQLQPCSYDVVLDNFIFTMADAETDGTRAIDARTKDLYGIEYVKDFIPKHGYCIDPDGFVLASTKEFVNIPDNIAARFEGKSSLGRLGLTTHVTAGFIDAGFSGQITLEIKNETKYPIYIYEGMKIGQLCFFELDKEARRPYGSEGLGSHYQGQTGPTVARG